MDGAKCKPGGASIFDPKIACHIASELEELVSFKKEKARHLTCETDIETCYLFATTQVLTAVNLAPSTKGAMPIMSDECERDRSLLFRC